MVEHVAPVRYRSGRDLNVPPDEIARLKPIQEAWFLLHGANPIGRREIWTCPVVLTRESGQVLDYAASSASFKTFLLLEYGAQPRYSLALHEAATGELMDDRWKIMKQLIEECGMDDNQTDEAMGPHRLETPLFDAGKRGSVEATKILLKYGADTTIRNHRGETALDQAESWHRMEVAGLLRESIFAKMMRLETDGQFSDLGKA